MNLNKKNILITGGTGSFGTKFVEKVLTNFEPNKLIVYSRDEMKQLQLIDSIQKKFGSEYVNNMRMFIGDVRDKERLSLATREVDIIVHAAALKQVPTAEYNPMEAIKTNIIGAQNIIDVALNNTSMRVVALSTDKAANPINLYGATKLASDKLFIAANNLVGTKNIKFSVVRYGNVLGSRGSVVPYYLELFKNKVDTYPVTDKRMTRFWITLDEATEFVINTLTRMKGGEIFVPKIPSVKITDLVMAINPNAKIKYIGIRPGEKLHEVMCPRDEYLKVVEFKKYYVITPSVLINKKEDFLIYDNEKGRRVSIDFEYNSLINDNYLNVDEIRNYLNVNLNNYSR